MHLICLLTIVAKFSWRRCDRHEITTVLSPFTSKFLVAFGSTFDCSLVITVATKATNRVTRKTVQKNVHRTAKERKKAEKCSKDVSDAKLESG
jgi:hypothetical protein